MLVWQEFGGYVSAWRGGEMARPVRFERTTVGLEGRCSILLSYGRGGGGGAGARPTVGGSLPRGVAPRKRGDAVVGLVCV